MAAYYEQWLAREDEWAQQMNEKQKKALVKYLILTPTISVALLFAIGLLAGGGMALAMNNLKYGLIFGVGMDVILILCMLPSNPGKRYKKQMLKEFDRAEMDTAEREEFAAQLMGKYGPDSMQCIAWNDKAIGEERVYVTKDYVLRTSVTGNFFLIQLKDVEQIEVDIRTYMRTAGNRNMKVRYNTTEYPVFFKSKRDENKPAGWKEKFQASNPSLTFNSREIRDQVVEAIQRLSENEELLSYEK